MRIIYSQAASNMTSLQVTQIWRQIAICGAGMCALTSLLDSAVAVGAETGTELRLWNQYHTILWLDDSARQPGKQELLFRRLKEMGINTAMVYGSQNPKDTQGFPYYVENVVNRGLCLKWGAKVNDWPAFIDQWMKSGRPSSDFAREFCLDDPQWLDWARKQAREVASMNVEYRPLAYDIRDELSVTISANPFDYDFHPLAQAGFRKWLKTQYKDLDALNRQWETRYRNWDEVATWSTDEIKSRQTSSGPGEKGKPDWQAVQSMRFDPVRARKEAWRWNFSPWCDFRSYMDDSLVRILSNLRDTIHQTDPKTPVGIEGTQMPHAFGGYDLWRLSQALDWVEPYDIAESREIFGDFMRGKPLLCTVGEQDWRKAQRRLWHLLLLGDKGCIVWWSEDCLKGGDFALTKRAQELAPVLKELTSPLGQIWMRAQREADPVYILYSQASIQVDWLLESMPDGSTWTRRFSSFESDHNRMARTRSGWAKVLQDNGWSPQYVSSEQIENGFLRGNHPGLLVLPTALALSDKESDEILKFLADQPDRRQLICDGTPGVFDQHGRIREKPALEAVLDSTKGDREVTLVGGSTVQSTSNSPAAYLKDRLKPDQGLSLDRWMHDRIVCIKPEIDLQNAPQIRVHRYKLGNARLFAFERNIAYAMSEELKQLGGNESLEKPIEVKVTLPSYGFHGHLYDLQKRQYLGDGSVLTFTLDPWHPSLFALLPERATPETLLDILLKE